MLIKQLYARLLEVCHKTPWYWNKKAFFTRLPWHGHLQNAKQHNLEIACSEHFWAQPENIEFHTTKSPLYIEYFSFIDIAIVSRPPNIRSKKQYLMIIGILIALKDFQNSVYKSMKQGYFGRTMAFFWMFMSDTSFEAMIHSFQRSKTLMKKSGTNYISGKKGKYNIRSTMLRISSKQYISLVIHKSIWAFVTIPNCKPVSMWHWKHALIC